MDDNKEKVKKILNPIDVLVTAFGAMIGWGWVVSSGDWIYKSGVLGTVLGFMIGGTMIYFVGLTYSELTAAMPSNGGVLVFTYKALGHKGSFVCSWMMVFSYIGVVCFEACSIPTVIQYIFPSFLQGYLYTISGFDIYISWLLVAILSAFVIVFINIKGVKTAAVFQTILTFIVGAVGILLIVASVFNGSIENLEGQVWKGDGHWQIMQNVFAVSVIAPFFLFGFDVIPQVAEEINVPLKKIGKLMLLSIILAVLFYALVVFAVGYAINSEELQFLLKTDGMVTAWAMEKVFSSSAMAKVLIMGGICGIVSSWNSFLIGGSRALAAMSDVGMLPRCFGKIHKKYKTPYIAILIIGLLSILSVFLGRVMLVWIANTASFACCVAYCLVSISFLVIRKKYPDMDRPYNVKHHKLVGWIASVLSFFMILLYVIPNTSSSFNYQEWCIIIFWVLLGICLFSVKSHKSRNCHGKR